MILRKIILPLATILFFSASLFAQKDDKFSKSFAHDGTLFLRSTEQYDALSAQEKSIWINHYYKNCGQPKINISTTRQGGEIWMMKDSAYVLVDSWSVMDMKMDDYSSVELQRQGYSRWYYYVGGSASGQSGSHNFTGTLRCGTFLFKDYLDASGSISAGGMTGGGQTEFTLSLGVSTRAYLPFKIKDVNLAPYAGIGVAYLVKPVSNFDLQFLAGFCWFVGPGSLDFGFQYGTKSNGMLTIGYTFRPGF